jgi:predicted ATP-grasp superfamily ATP-dependent carboligase
VGRAAAERLDSNSSSAGVEIDEATAIEPRRKNIEQSLTKPVAGGTGLHPARGEQLTGAVGACDHAHL